MIPPPLPFEIRKRVAHANDIDAAIFITVHNNMHEGQAKGLEIFFGDGKGSEALAKSIGANIKSQNYDVRRIEHESQTAVKELTAFKDHNADDRPLIVLEGGFVDHPEDLKKIQHPDFIDQYSNAVAQGIASFAKTRGYQQETSQVSASNSSSVNPAGQDVAIDTSFTPPVTPDVRKPETALNR